MPPLAETQAAFAAALADPAMPVPGNVLGARDLPDARRFAVYRNNVAVSLIEALRARFPVVARLVGEDFFAAMAGAYARAHPPRSPLLFLFGDGLPAFIEAFEPAADLPYLPDVARLEIAWSRAYHAAEAVPVGVAAIAALPPADLSDLRLTLHPSVGLVASPHPVVGIWAAHQTCGPVVPPDEWVAEDGMVVRPDADVLVHRLPPGGGAFAAAVLAGAPLGEAAEAGVAAAPAFDFGRSLVGLFQAGAVVAVRAATLSEPSA